MKPTFFCWVAWGVMIFSCASFARAAIIYSVVAQLGASAPGYVPNQIVEAGDGNYYGTTTSGGTNNNGTIFRITSSGAVTPLYSFTGGNDGSRPVGSLTLGNDGKLYGTASLGGADSAGTFFSITTGGTFTLLHTFDGTSEGGAPSFVVKGSDGRFYGTSALGGTDSTQGGTFVQITTAGAVTVLHNFNADLDGDFVNANIVQGSDGAFYGSTQMGGLNGEGTIYRITTSQAFSVLDDLDSSDITLLTTLGADGLIYGTNGGGTITSTVFKMTNAGVQTTVHSFTDATDGYNISSFVLGSDGNYYGLTTNGGPGGYGTFFQIQPSGTFTVLYSFSTYPTDFGNLTQGSDGNFYSSTAEDVTGGAIIQLTTAGTPTILATFSSPGYNSVAALMQAADGEFYGTTEYGGVTDDGTVFQATLTGTLADVADFNFATSGSRPIAPLVQDPVSGNLVATTYTGGPNYDSVLNMGGAIDYLAQPSVNSSLVHEAFLDQPAYDYGNEYLTDIVQKVLLTIFGVGKSSIILNSEENYARYTYGFKPPPTIPGGNAVPALASPNTSGTTGVSTTPIFSVCSSGGDNNEGLFLDYNLDGTLNTSYSLGDQTTDGIGPQSKVVSDASGNLYGTTVYGGTAGLGTVFKITPASGTTYSTFTTIHNFTGTNNSNPSASDGASGGSNYGFANKPHRGQRRLHLRHDSGGRRI